MADATRFNEAITHHREGRLNAAQNIYTGILLEDPNHAGALHLLGVIRQQQGAHQAAVDLISRAIKACPGKAIYYSNYGAALVSLDRLNEALASFQRALEIRPDFADAHANLGMAQAALGDAAAAEASFRRALQIRAWHCDSVVRLAALLGQHGRQAEAFELLESAIAAAPCPQFDFAINKLRLFGEWYVAAVQTTLSARPNNVRGGLRRLLTDGTYHYTYDSHGNRTARFRSGAGILDRFATDITVYEWSNVDSVISIKTFASGDDYSRKIAAAQLAFPCGERHAAINDTSSENSVYDAQYWPFGMNFVKRQTQADIPVANGGTSHSGAAESMPEVPQATRKIAFVSPHCLIDFTNGAATATLDGLELLSEQGFTCQAYCGTRLDAWGEVLMEEILARESIPYRVRNMQVGQGRGRIIFARRGQVAVTMFNTASTRGGWIDREEVDSFLAGCETFLRENRPDVVWTYGGDAVSLSVQAIAKQLNIPIVFALHNFNYRDLGPFQQTDYTIVPAEFARQFYRDRIGLDCSTLPLVIDRQRVISADRTPEFVTFVNPEPRKGVLVFLRIALELAARRPDIRLLVVEGAAKLADLPKLYGRHLGVDLAGLRDRLTNVTIMPNDADARKFYRRTKILLMPSLMENAALVASEAMMNGIPVVVSNRGGLPETVGNAGVLLDIPSTYTTETIAIPTVEEVEPWIAVIERLWDDPAECEHWSQAGRVRAEMWSPERLGPVYREFFKSLRRQPGPPIVAK